MQHFLGLSDPPAACLVPSSAGCLLLSCSPKSRTTLCEEVPATGSSSTTPSGCHEPASTAARLQSSMCDKPFSDFGAFFSEGRCEAREEKGVKFKAL